MTFPSLPPSMICIHLGGSYKNGSHIESDHYSYVNKAHFLTLTWFRKLVFASRVLLNIFSGTLKRKWLWSNGAFSMVVSFHEGEQPLVSTSITRLSSAMSYLHFPYWCYWFSLDILMFVLIFTYLLISMHVCIYWYICICISDGDSFQHLFWRLPWWLKQLNSNQKLFNVPLW